MKARGIILWLAVGIPLLWGVLKTLQNAMKLFRRTIHEPEHEPESARHRRPDRGRAHPDRSRLLNYIVAIYLIVTGLIGLFPHLR